jgi:hypothetical protein
MTTLHDLLKRPEDWDGHDCAFYLPSPDDEPILTAHWKYQDGRKVSQRYKLSLELSEIKELPASEKCSNEPPVSVW